MIKNSFQFWVQRCLSINTPLINKGSKFPFTPPHQNPNFEMKTFCTVSTEKQAFQVQKKPKPLFR